MLENIYKLKLTNYWRNIDKKIFFSFIVLFSLGLFFWSTSKYLSLIISTISGSETLVKPKTIAKNRENIVTIVLNEILIFMALQNYFLMFLLKDK